MSAEPQPQGTPDHRDHRDPLRQRLLRGMLHTIRSYGLLSESDRVLVAVSGGKNSYTLLDLL